MHKMEDSREKWVKRVESHVCAYIYLIIWTLCRRGFLSFNPRLILLDIPHSSSSYLKVDTICLQDAFYNPDMYTMHSTHLYVIHLLIIILTVNCGQKCIKYTVYSIQRNDFLFLCQSVSLVCLTTIIYFSISFILNFEWILNSTFLILCTAFFQRKKNLKSLYHCTFCTLFTVYA